MVYFSIIYFDAYNNNDIVSVESSNSSLVTASNAF